VTDSEEPVTDSPTPETGAEATPAAEPAPAAPTESVTPAAAPAATVEAPAPAAAPTPAPVAESPAPAPAAVAPKAKKSVQVPVWALVGVLAVVLVLGAFFVGRATAPKSDSGPKTLAEAVEMTASGKMDVGDFNARRLLEALSQNGNLDLGLLGDLLGGGGSGGRN